MSITLYKKGETTPHTFTQSVRDLKDTTKGGGEFTRAEVTAGDWIFYAKKDYRGDVKDVKKVKGDEKHVTITSVNGSMFLVDAGLILFEEFRFRGERKVLRI